MLNNCVVQLTYGTLILVHSVLKLLKCGDFILETFNTSVDIKLRQWAESTLPAQSVECGWESLKSEFQRFMQKASIAPDHDDIFDELKKAVVNEAMKRHKWEDKVC